MSVKMMHTGRDVKQDVAVVKENLTTLAEQTQTAETIALTAMDATAAIYEMILAGTPNETPTA